MSTSYRSSKAWQGEYTMARDAPGYTGVRQMPAAGVSVPLRRRSEVHSGFVRICGVDLCGQDGQEWGAAAHGEVGMGEEGLVSQASLRASSASIRSSISRLIRSLGVKFSFFTFILVSPHRRDLLIHSCR